MSALLSSLFIQVGLAYLQPVSDHGTWGLSEYDRTHLYNPYGTIEIGLEAQPDRRFSFSLSVRHQSAIPVNDWGDNSFEVAVKWKPFRQ